MDEVTGDSWINNVGLTDDSNFKIYLTSVYFSLMCMTTIGYGDVTAQTLTERVTTTFFMLIGVFYYMFSQGQLISLIMSYDDACADFLIKMNLATDIKIKYNISIELFNEMRKSLKQNRGNKSKRYMEFID